MSENAISLWIGACISGFFFLAGWCWYLNSKVSGVLATAKKVDEIHTALLGDMKTEGLISKTRRIDENCKIRHGELKKEK